MTTCPECAAEVEADQRFCENCGRELTARRVALPHDSTPATACPDCAGTEFDQDNYCVGCGRLRPAPDRFEADLGAAYVLTDRGISHSRNEDAVAAAVLDGPGGQPAATLIVVSDGVSTSEDPQAASGAAARAGVDAGLAALREQQSAEEAVMAGLSAAAQAVRAMGEAGGHAPSCTYVSAIVQPNGTGMTITVANVGDSRAYWLRADTSGSDISQAPGDDPTVELDISTSAAPGDDTSVELGNSTSAVPGTHTPAAEDTDTAPAKGTPAAGRNPPSQRLTVDDSYAQALVDAGAMDEEAAMKEPRAHMLLRWLGADSEPVPWSANCVSTLHTTGPGVLLLCSDGLWNYRSAAAALAPMATGAAPADAARELADFAMQCGGSDNITVALVPIQFDQPGEVR